MIKNINSKSYECSMVWDSVTRQVGFSLKADSIRREQEEGKKDDTVPNDSQRQMLALDRRKIDRKILND